MLDETIEGLEVLVLYKVIISVIAIHDETVALSDVGILLAHLLGDRANLRLEVL